VTALTGLAALTLAAACQSAVDPVTMVGIASHESRLEPFAIHDNTDRRSFAPQTRPEAARLAHSLIAAGHSVDIGLTQINASNFGWLGLTVETALDPCRDIAAGASVLTAYSRYNTGNPSTGVANGYALKVSAAVGVARASVPIPPTERAPAPGAPNLFSRPSRTGRDVEFGIDTELVTANSAPNDMRARLIVRDGTVKLGLMDAWRYVRHCKPYSIIETFWTSQARDGNRDLLPMSNFATSRNRSILAHGHVPIGNDKCAEILDWTAEPFMAMIHAEAERLGETCDMPQLPTELPEPHPRPHGEPHLNDKLGKA
jgi:type IV secretion system protein VirB1